MGYGLKNVLDFFPLDFSKYSKYLIIQNFKIKKGPGNWKNSGIINPKIIVRSKTVSLNFQGTLGLVQLSTEQDSSHPSERAQKALRNRVG